MLASGLTPTTASTSEQANVEANPDDRSERPFALVASTVLGTALAADPLALTRMHLIHYAAAHPLSIFSAKRVERQPTDSSSPVQSMQFELSSVQSGADARAGAAIDNLPEGALGGRDALARVLDEGQRLSQMASRVRDATQLRHHVSTFKPGSGRPAMAWKWQLALLVGGTLHRSGACRSARERDFTSNDLSSSGRTPRADAHAAESRSAITPVSPAISRSPRFAGARSRRDAEQRPDEDAPFAEAARGVQAGLANEMAALEGVYQQIEITGANTSTLLELVDEHRRVAQAALISALAGTRAEDSWVAKLTIYLGLIEDLRMLVESLAEPATLLEKLDVLSPGHPIGLEDILIGRIADGNGRQQDFLSLADIAYPSSTDIDELIDGSLSEVVHKAGADQLAAETVVAVRIHEINPHGVLEPAGEVRETLRNIALGTLYKANWNGHIEVLGLPPAVARLFRKPRYYGSSVFPVSTKLLEELNRRVAKLETQASKKCREVIFAGLMVEMLGNFTNVQTGFPEVEGPLHLDSSIRLVKFDNGKRTIILSNVFTIEINSGQCLLFDLGVNEVLLIDHDNRNVWQTSRIMKEIVIRNSPLADKALLLSSKDVEYLFSNQKLTTFGWIKPYVAPGRLYFHDEKMGIRQGAALLASLELSTLKKDRDYLFTTEREVFWHGIVAGTQSGLSTMQQALLLPAGGWVPHLLGLGLGGINLAISYAKKEYANDREAQERYAAEVKEHLTDCVLNGIFWRFASRSGKVAGSTNVARAKVSGSKTNVRTALKTGDEQHVQARYALRARSRQHALSSSAPELTRDIRLAEDQGAVIVKQIQREKLFGQYVNYQIVQRFSTRANRFESGYIEFDTYAVHGARVAGEPFEKNWSKTLLITAHGRHVFKPTQNTPKVAVPWNMALDFYAPFGFSLRDPGLRSSILVNPILRPAVSLSSRFPHVTVSRPHAHAVRVQGGEFWDATGLMKTQFDPSGRLVLHDLTLMPYPKDTPFEIHRALRDACQLSIAQPIDVISIRSETTLGHILDTLPGLHKYSDIKVSACRILRGGDVGTEAAKIPQWSKAQLIERVQNAPEVGELLQVGVRRQIFEQILQDHDRLKRENAALLTVYEKITTYQPSRSFQKRDVAAERDSECVFFPLLGLYSELDVRSSNNSSGSTFVGYVAAVGEDMQILISRDMEVFIQPESAVMGERRP